MKREIIEVTDPGSCCPGHDKYPDDTYRSRRSTKARRRDKKLEHQHARSVLKQRLMKESYDVDFR